MTRASAREADANQGSASTRNWELIDIARSGDERALSSLYERHVDEVFRYVSQRTKNIMLAEDLTSETFVRALSKLNTLRHRRSTFRAWLFTIARNLLFDHTRARTRRQECALPDNLDLASDSADPATTTCVNAVSEELWRALDHLTDDQRRCIVLRFFDELSVAEAAARMDRNCDSLRALQARAIRKLATIVSPELTGV